MPVPDILCMCNVLVHRLTLCDLQRHHTLQTQPVRVQGAMVRASRAHNLMCSNEAQY